MLSLTASEFPAAHRFMGLILALASGLPGYAAESRPKHEVGNPRSSVEDITSVAAPNMKTDRAPAAEAQPKSAPPGEARPPIFAPRPAVKSVPGGRPRLLLPAAGSGRALSPEMSKRLSEVMERAASVSALGSARVVASAPPADRSSDALMMDPFVINEAKERSMKEWDLLTPKEKLALALRNNRGLKLGFIPLGNDDVARELLEDKFEQQRRAELAELSSLLNAAGKKAPPKVQRQIDEASTRKNGWLDQEPGTPFRVPR